MANPDSKLSDLEIEEFSEQFSKRYIRGSDVWADTFCSG